MKKVIIVGGGIGGLSAGIYALKAGYQAEIYEKNPVAGGECMGWNRKGCHIDNCIHWLTGTDESTGLWQVWNTMGAIDKDTPYADTNKFYTSTYNGQEATLWKDLDKTERELIAISPEDEAEIKKFIEYTRYAESCVIPSEKPMDMMGVGDYIKMGKSMANMPKVMKEYGKIDLRGLADRFRSPLLEKLMTDYLPPEYTAYSLLVSYATMTSGNGNIPLGGSLAMTNRIIKRFEDMGGKLHLKTPVKSIIVENSTAKGIEFESGEKVYGDEIIAAVDAAFLFNKLLGKSYMTDEWKKAFSERAKYPVTSGFQAAYMIDSSFSGDDTIFFDCEPIKIGDKSFDRLSVKSYAYDKSFAPEGKTVLQVNIPQSDDEYKYWKSLDKDGYKKVKAELTEQLTERIVKQFPELDGKMAHLDTWSPLTYARYCNAYHGSYMGFVTKTDAKQLRVKGTIKGLNNFCMAGQWIMSPGGLPIAAVSGKFAIQRILKKEKRSIEI